MHKDTKSEQSCILVVDDDPDVREILAEALGEFGYAVVLADSGDAALARLAQDRPINMMITDIRMPGMSGTELAGLARKSNPALKIVLMSGYFQPQTISEAFLRKPFHIHELASVVRAELG